MIYLTDGIHLYEVLARHTVENFGLLRGAFRHAIVCDCASGAVRRMDDLELALCEPVG